MPSTPPLDVAVIVGSTREGRRGRTVADWFVDVAGLRSDLRLELIDLAELDLPDRYPARPDRSVSEYRSRLSRADAVVVVTPEYNHSYPASLKHAIDLAKAEWKRKPVALVSYGGISGGLRAAEHLRQVFAELHAFAIRDTVSFHGPWNGFGADDRPTDEPGARDAVTVMLDDLVWWGSALSSARAAEPVGAW